MTANAEYFRHAFLGTVFSFAIGLVLLAGAVGPAVTAA